MAHLKHFSPSWPVENGPFSACFRLLNEIWVGSEHFATVLLSPLLTFKSLRHK